jgi:hypothetical protein
MALGDTCDRKRRREQARYHTWRLAWLIDECGLRGLDKTGLKSALAGRLEEADTAITAAAAAVTAAAAKPLAEAGGAGGNDDMALGP